MNKPKSKKKASELVYGEHFDGCLVFLEREEAELWAGMHDAVQFSRDSGFAWGEFKLKYPHAYKWFEEYFGWDTTFEQWYAENRDDGEWESLEEAREEYELGFEEMTGNGPLMRSKFDLPSNYEESLQEGHGLGAQRNDFLPGEILEEFGDYDSDVEIWRLDPEDEEGIVSALNALGYLCEKNSDLICKACSLW